MSEEVAAKSPLAAAGNAAAAETPPETCDGAADAGSTETGSEETTGPAGSESTPQVTARLRPVTTGRRLESLDTLRGVAVLSILVMNIYAFAMPFPAYGNPLIYGGTAAIDLGTWVFTHVFFELKFLSIFSMLFGAGVVLMSERAEARGTKLAGIYYRRQFWLLVIGAIHGYLLWFGDILFNYASCGLLLYLFRRRSPRTLIIIGSLMLLIAAGSSTGGGYYFTGLRAGAEEAEALLAAGEKLSEEQEKIRQSWADMEPEMAPTMFPNAETLKEDLDLYRGDHATIVIERAPTVFMMQTMAFAFFLLWRAGGLMFIGMALMKLGVLSAQRSDRFYKICIGVGYGLGLPIEALGTHQLFVHQFDFLWVLSGGFSYNYFGSLLVCCGHLGLVMWICKTGILSRLRARLAAVGRMAFSNYLMHSILLTMIFYGYGLGLYGHVDRFYQMGFVIAVWLLQLYLSTIWLARFRFGPAEWLWRSLTYWQRQPMRRQPAETFAAPASIERKGIA